MSSSSPPADPREREESVLILAPTSRDAVLCRTVLAEAGVECVVTRSIGELCGGIDNGAGLAVLSEETLTTEALALLRGVIQRQPAWSDFPLLVLTEEGADSEVALRTLEILGNVTLLERPVRIPALVSSVRAALRARRRQYQIRDYLRESNRVAESLREADRRKDEFLAILAHELRNPLAPLRNAVEVMRRKPREPAVLAWSQGLIERQVSQMVRLIDDLLDLSRVSRGRIELKYEDIELGEVIRDALEICRPAIRKAGHELRVTLPEERVVVHCDATRLVQIVCNLLSNAAKYTPPGGRIALEAHASDAWVEVRVRDNGIGIPQDMLAKVFDMFTQVEHSKERSQGGLGIGLTLVKRLAEMHGGSVEARSRGAGQGSEFSIRLPRFAAHAAGTPLVLQAAAVQGEAAGATHRILVADDNRDAADSLAFMLRVVGHDVRTAYDGQQAVDIAEDFRPALAVLDIGMPRLNGYEAARTIRGKPFGQDIVLVALTGWGQPEDRHKSQVAGFDHHLVKPVDPSVLARLLASPPKAGAGAAAR